MKREIPIIHLSYAEDNQALHCGQGEFRDTDKLRSRLEIKSKKYEINKQFNGLFIDDVISLGSTFKASSIYIKEHCKKINKIYGCFVAKATYNQEKNKI